MIRVFWERRSKESLPETRRSVQSDVGNSKEDADDLGRQTTMIDRKSAQQKYMFEEMFILVHFM